MTLLPAVHMNLAYKEGLMTEEDRSILPIETRSALMRGLGKNNSNWKGELGQHGMAKHNSNGLLLLSQSVEHTDEESWKKNGWSRSFRKTDPETNGCSFLFHPPEAG